MPRLRTRGTRPRLGHRAALALAALSLTALAVSDARAQDATGAQPATAGRVPRKHPALGAALSIVPGAGQVYAGRRMKGAALFAVTYGGFYLAANGSECHGTRGRNCDDRVLFTGLGLAVGTWIYAIASAPADVRRWNVRHGHVASAPRVTPHLARSAAGTQLGVAAAW
jgi:hypothetical protein